VGSNSESNIIMSYSSGTVTGRGTRTVFPLARTH